MGPKMKDQVKLWPSVPMANESQVAYASNPSQSYASLVGNVQNWSPGPGLGTTGGVQDMVTCFHKEKNVSFDQISVCS